MRRKRRWLRWPHHLSDRPKADSHNVVTTALPPFGGRARQVVGWWLWLRRDARGVTLVDTLVAMFIFTLVSGLVFAVFASTQQMWRSGNATLDIKFDAHRGLGQMLNELRQLAGSSGVAVSQNPTVITWNPLVDADGDGTYVNAATRLWEFDLNRTVTYAVTPQNQLVRTEADLNTGQSTTTILANNVTGLQAALARSGPVATLSLTVDLQRTASEPGGTRAYTGQAASALQLRHLDVGPVIAMTSGAPLVQPTNTLKSYAGWIPPDSFPSQ